MKEKNLLKLALVCSIIGLIGLYIISIKIDIPDYKPSSLNLEIGKDVNLKGKILKISERENVIFLDLMTEHAVTTIVFSDEPLSLEEGNFVEIIGTIQEYNGKEEIIAEKIRVIDIS